MTETAPPPAAPAPPQSRILALDVVRGFAVLGILIMNVVEFGQPLRAYENPACGGGSEGWSRYTWFVQMALFDGRMRALFSMLFGAGLVLIDQRMQRQGRGGEAADLLLRRCLWLVPFGMVHRFVLQWTGDILYVYGLLGVIAVAFRRARPRTQILAGVLCLTAFVPIAFWHHHQAEQLRSSAAEAVSLEAAGEPVPAALANARKRWEGRTAVPKADDVKAEVAAIRSGYGSVFAYRWDYHHSFQSDYVYYYFVWDVLGMMLVGMGLMRLGFFAGTMRTRTCVVLLLAGAAAAVASLLWARAWADAGFSGGALGLRLVQDCLYGYLRGIGGLGWAAALMLVVRAGALRWLTAPLAAVGRMAFSNYVLQTVCCTLFFFGYGLGFYGQLSRAELMLVWVGVSAVQVAFSMLWLRRFWFGPLEWAWRSLTYGRRPPLRKGGGARMATVPA